MKYRRIYSAGLQPPANSLFRTGSCDSRHSGKSFRKISNFRATTPRITENYSRNDVFKKWTKRCLDGKFCGANPEMQNEISFFWRVFHCQFAEYEISFTWKENFTFSEISTIFQGLLLQPATIIWEFDLKNSKLKLMYDIFSQNVRLSSFKRLRN